MEGQADRTEPHYAHDARNDELEFNKNSKLASISAFGLLVTCVSCWIILASNAMPRSSDAKEWRPDALGQEMIDRMANFIIVAERCAAQLRSFNFPSIERLWAQVQADFQGDPVKYPAVMADHDDVESRKQFQMKCEAICFPPKSRPPRSPEE